MSTHAGIEQEDFQNNGSSLISELAMGYIVLAIYIGLLIVSTFCYCGIQNNGSSKMFTSSSLEYVNRSGYLAKEN